MGEVDETQASANTQLKAAIRSALVYLLGAAVHLVSVAAAVASSASESSAAAALVAVRTDARDAGAGRGLLDRIVDPGVQFHWMLGLITGVAVFVPCVETVATGVPAVLMGLQKSPATAIYVLIFYTAPHGWRAIC